MADATEAPAEEGVFSQQQAKLTCRFYKEEYPKNDEVVVAKVREIGEMGAYAKLLEYNGREGMILMSELSRRRIRSVNKLVRIGKDEYVVVLRADQEKGYIDLSKRRATPEDKEIADNRYQKQKTVHSIVCHSGTQLNLKTNEELESLMDRAVWHFDEKYKVEDERNRASYNYFRRAVEDPTVLDECDLTQQEKDVIMKNIKNRMMPTPDKIRADIKIRCSGPAGIQAVIESLNHGMDMARKQAVEEGLIKNMNVANNNQGSGDAKVDGPSHNLINITLISSPEYVVTLHTLDKEKGMANIKYALECIKDRIATFEHGEFAVKEAPRVVGAEDDAALKSAMDTIEMQNREVPADDEEEE